MHTEEINTFISYLKDYQAELPLELIDKLTIFASLIHKNNRALNLVSDHDVNSLWTRHFLDSLTPFLLGLINKPADIIDIGSGAGLPGIPLALLNHQFSVTMIDSNSKKARFIERSILELEIDNANIINGRWENINRKFDYCLSRAVFSGFPPLGKLAQIIHSQGKLILFKGKQKPNIEPDEINNAGFLNSEFIILPDKLFKGKSLLVLTKS
ncbi:16S rRNA (guanine(527)-N(7))-methyltransferase RsmG [bacterium]|nr:16S rRNA (guanine(527)-N(7))-methyltransferase RsmG [bacterium]